MRWAVGDVCYVEQGLFEAAVLGTLANEVWAICESSAVRIGARRAGELGWERERESCGNEGGRRWVGGERCRTKRVGSGERLTREASALKNVTWSGSAHRPNTRDMRRLSSEIGSAARPTRFRGCHMPSSHFDYFFPSTVSL